MKFLQARRLLRETEFSDRKSLLLASSGQTENLDVYLRAEFALGGIDCEISHTAFNTLEQELLGDAWKQDLEAVILFPWDFLPSLDWRTGIVAADPDPQACFDRIARFAATLGRKKASIFFLDAPVPPIFNNLRQQQDIARRILGTAIDSNVDIIDASAFHLAAYLESGAPIGGRHCGRIAQRIANSLLVHQPAQRRVLVTDLDNVMWGGVIGEDGADGIEYSPAGRGYPHFLYQGYLKKIETAGILIAAVSKNDPDLARLPFTRGDMLLGIEDLVTIQASYYPKSTQIENIALKLNLPQDAFVFVDDNPIEVEQVRRALPQVDALLFPTDPEGLPLFFARLGERFDLREATGEDLRRTSMYQTRLKGMAPASASDCQLADFLRELEMKIRIFERGSDDSERALQLFNKTNQFNLNGYRIGREMLDDRLAQGGRLYTAWLSDRHGDHGEILACLLNSNRDVELLVMSCRVFQRRVEHFFLNWIASGLLPAERPVLRLDYRPTERNTPFELFLRQIGVEPRPGWIYIGSADLAGSSEPIESLFEVSVG